MTQRKNTITRNHHLYSKCEGCGRQRKATNIVWFMGHYLCGICKRRSNMPLVGFKNKVAWELELKIERKNRLYPFITWTEKQALWKFYDSKGLSDEEKKHRIRSLQYRVRANHRSSKPMEVHNE